MNEKQQHKPEFQVIWFKLKLPDGTKIQRPFIGQALLTSEEIKKHKDLTMGELLDPDEQYPIELEQPYNPYEDEDNIEAHKHLTDLTRKVMDNDEDAKSD